MTTKVTSTVLLNGMAGLIMSFPLVSRAEISSEDAQCRIEKIQGLIDSIIQVAPQVVDFPEEERNVTVASRNKYLAILSLPECEEGVSLENAQVSEEALAFNPSGLPVERLAQNVERSIRWQTRNMNEAGQVATRIIRAVIHQTNKFIKTVQRGGIERGLNLNGPDAQNDKKLEEKRHSD